MKTNPVTMSPYTVLTLAVESVSGSAGHNGPNMAICLLFSPIIQHLTGVTYLTKGNLVGFHPSNPYAPPPPMTSWELLGVFLCCGLGWFQPWGVDISSEQNFDQNTQNKKNRCILSLFDLGVTLR